MAAENFSFPPNSGDDDVQLFLKFQCKRYSVRREKKAQGGTIPFLKVKLPMPPNMVATSALSFAKDATIESSIVEMGLEGIVSSDSGPIGMLRSMFTGAFQSAFRDPNKAFQVQMDAGEMIFNEAVSRVFQFNYQLVARNYQEAEVISKIASAFEGYALPRVSTTLKKFRMEMPPIWTWAAVDAGGNPLPNEHWTGQNKPAFLQNVTVDRTSSGGVYSLSDGSGESSTLLPLSTSIALQFVEIEPNIFDSDSNSIKSRSQIITGEKVTGLAES
jgi:hypothetical protein